MRHYKRKKVRAATSSWQCKLKKYLKKSIHSISCKIDSTCILIHCIMKIICFYALFVFYCVYRHIWYVPVVCWQMLAYYRLLICSKHEKHYPMHGGIESSYSGGNLNFLSELIMTYWETLLGVKSPWCSVCWLLVHVA